MFGTVFKELYGLLNKRFVLNALFPALLFGTGLVVTWEATGEGLGAGTARLSALDGVTATVVTLLAVAGILLAAILLTSQSSNLLRWAEGSAGPLSWSFLSDPGTAWWVAQQSPTETTSPSFRIPRQGRPVGPTALGTLGYANGEYVERAYGADIAVVWPRLSPLVSTALASSIDDTETAMEQLLAFAATVIAFGIAAGWIAAYHRAAVAVCVLVPLASFALGFVLYRALLPAAERWSQLVRTAFDLCRFQLLDALQLARTRTTSEECALWKRLNAFLQGQEQGRPFGLMAKKD
jgi:hypothetical protein